MAKHRHATAATHGMTKRQRMYKHILESALDRGMDFYGAQRLAAATVNKFRARSASRHKGPKLVGRGGSRRQWYPGKKLTKEVFVCLQHDRKFKTRAGLERHYRSQQHRTRA
jgi:hypothetical protein